MLAYIIYVYMVSTQAQIDSSLGILNCIEVCMLGKLSITDYSPSLREVSTGKSPRFYHTHVCIVENHLLKTMSQGL